MKSINQPEIEGARIAIEAYKQAKGGPDEGLEAAIDLLADLFSLLRNEGADIQSVIAMVNQNVSM